MHNFRDSLDESARRYQSPYRLCARGGVSHGALTFDCEFDNPFYRVYGGGLFRTGIRSSQQDPRRKERDFLPGDFPVRRHQDSRIFTAERPYQGALLEVEGGDCRTMIATFDPAGFCIEGEPAIVAPFCFRMTFEAPLFQDRQDERSEKSGGFVGRFLLIGGDSRENLQAEEYHNDFQYRIRDRVPEFVREGEQSL